MKTLIIGANGKIGKIVCQKCTAQKIPSVAMIRSPGQAGWFINVGMDTVIADLEEEFAQAFEGCNQVVFTAGSGGHTGGDKTLLVDLYGAMRAIDLSRKNKIEKFIMVSARRAGSPMDTPLTIRHYMVAKKIADDYLQASDLNYTILRPGKLTDEPATGNFAQESHKGNPDNSISREDVADVILECIQGDAYSNQVVPMVRG